MEKQLELIKQALNKASLKGAFTLDESYLIGESLNNFTMNLQKQKTEIEELYKELKNLKINNKGKDLPKQK